MTYSVVCPAHWTKAQLLRYVRAEHPEDSVRIVDWTPSGKQGDSWEQRLWIANPAGFSDYARGQRSVS